MHPQSTEQPAGTVRVAFDVMAGIEPLTFPVNTTNEEIAYQVQRAFLAADDMHPANAQVAINVEAGTVVVSVDGDVIEHGSITRSEPEPDHWLTLADDLRQAADTITTLAGTPAPPSHMGSASLYVASSVVKDFSGEVTPIVDRIAAAFGVEAADAPIGAGSGSWEHKASARVGALDVRSYVFIPTPEDAEKAALRAELEQLRAQLAEGGAR